jgi:protein-tyrosine phosphatase
MIDIHTHVLPDIDDGPRDILEATRIVKCAFESGTRTIVATPHVLNRLDFNRNMIIMKNYNETRRHLESEVPGLTLLFGSEIYFQPKLVELLEFETATINGGGRYMLIEFPLIDIPKQFDRELKELHKGGVTPIIAHPERNVLVQKQPDLVRKMIDDGAVIQMNAGSLTGVFGRTVKKMAQSLLKKGWVHLIASDAHSVNSRGPDLQAALEVAANVIGMAAARRLVQDHPQRIIEGSPWPGAKTVCSIAGGTR